MTETASAANEMTLRIREVAGEAADTDRQAGAVRRNAGSLESAVESLGHTVIRIVRTSGKAWMDDTVSTIPAVSRTG